MPITKKITININKEAKTYKYQEKTALLPDIGIKWFNAINADGKYGYW